MHQPADFGRKLMEKRVEKGYTQRQLADKSGVNIATISCYENGRSWPSLEFAIALADTLDCTVYDLWY